MDAMKLGEEVRHRALAMWGKESGLPADTELDRAFSAQDQGVRNHYLRLAATEIRNERPELFSDLGKGGIGL